MTTKHSRPRILVQDGMNLLRGGHPSFNSLRQSSDNLLPNEGGVPENRPSLFSLQTCASSDPNASAVEESIFRANTLNEIEDINKNNDVQNSSSAFQQVYRQHNTNQGNIQSNSINKKSQFY